MRTKMIAILLTLTTACGGMSASVGGGSSVTEEASFVGSPAHGPSAGGAAVTSGGDFGGVAEGGESAGVAVADVAPSRSEAVPPSSAAATTSTTSTTVTVETVTEITIPHPQEPVQIQQAQLTAASVGDHDRRDNYLDFLARQAHFGQELGIDTSRRVRFRVVDGHGRPVNDARVDITLGNHRATGRTHADGIWDFHPGVSMPGFAGRGTARLTAGQMTRAVTFDVPSVGDGGEILMRLDGTQTAMPAALDLAFAIDVTGSMEDELRYVNSEITDIVSRIHQAAPEARVRVAATFYRDRTDRHVVQQIAFTEDVRSFAQAMQGVRASGGGDYPEDMNAGLDAALNRLSWSTGNAARVLVLIADAPPKRYGDARFTYMTAMNQAAARGIRILPVAASGADRKVEYLFRALGVVSSTPYVYLTDDSGIGNRHQEADTDRVAIEYFADMLTRLVVSDLRGEGMHEPGVFGPYRQ